MFKNLRATLICHRNYLDQKLSYRNGGSDDLLPLFKKNYLINFSHDEYTNLNKSIISVVELKDNRKKSICTHKKKKYNFIVYNIIKFFYLLKYLNKFKTDFIISADCFLCFQSILINFLFFKKKKIIFHITDYSENRFDNYLLNKIYNFLFHFSCYFSNYITCPSKKIIHKIKYKKKIFFFPNSPSMIRKNLVIKKKNNNNGIFSLVNIDDGTDWNLILNFLKIINKKKLNFKLYITGHIKTKFSKIILDKFRSIDLKKRIVFVGYLNKKKLYQLYNKCTYGLTAYKKTLKHKYWNFGDSLKIREYAESGLIVLTEGLYYNSLEIKKFKFGKTYKTSNDLYKLVKLFMHNQNKTNSYRVQSRKWALANRKNLYLKKIENNIRQDLLEKM